MTKYNQLPLLIWSSFLEFPEKCSHPKSHSKISNLMTTKLFLHVFLILRELLFIEEIIGLAGSKTFWGIQETGSDSTIKSRLCCSLKNIFYTHSSNIYGYIFNEIFSRNVCVFLIRVRELFQFVSFTLKHISLFLKTWIFQNSLNLVDLGAPFLKVVFYSFYRLPLQANF